jgi:hypothetical protein
MLGFKIGGPTREERAARIANEAATEGRVSRAIAEYQRAIEEAEPEPIVTHHPINEELQTGDSRLLGGAMEIRAPWRDSED